MNKVVSLHKYLIEKQYQEFGSTALDLRLDTTYPANETKRNYALELTQGYIRLLSNFKG